MANVYATKSGNWSDTTVWNTGALPTSADDVYSNTFTVTIDQDVTVLSLRNTSTTGVTAGGGFTCSTARTIDCSGGSGLVNASSLLTLSNTTGTVTLRGTVNGPSGAGTTLTINGAGGTVAITGNATAGAQNNCTTISVAANATVSITGNLTGAGGNYAATTLNVATISTVSVVGSVTGGAGLVSSTCYVNAAATVSFTGNLTGAGKEALFISNFAHATTITGTLTGGSAVAVITSANGTLTLSGPFISGPTGIPPFAAYCITKLTGIANNEFRFAKSTGGTTSLYSGDVTSGSPSAADVRYGTTYGTGGALTGTLRVPATSSVAYGVPVDNTTGTAAVKLQDVAAVVAAQIAAALST